MTPEQARAAVVQLAAELEAMQITLRPCILVEKELACGDDEYPLDFDVCLQGWPSINDDIDPPSVYAELSVSDEGWERDYRLLFGNMPPRSRQCSSDEFLPGRSRPIREWLLTIHQEHLERTQQQFWVRLDDRPGDPVEQLLRSAKKRIIDAKYCRREAPSLTELLAEWIPLLVAWNERGVIPLETDDSELRCLVPEAAFQRVVIAAARQAAPLATS